VPEQVSLKDLGDNEEWQRMQNSFSDITGVGIRILEENGKPFTTPSQIPRLCSDFLKNFKQEVNTCLPSFLGGTGTVDKNLSYSCHDGLRNFILPIRLKENKIIGYVILGPVILIARDKKEEYAKLAEEMGMKLDDLWSALLEIRVVSMRGIKSMVKFAEDIIEYAIKTTHNKIIKETDDLNKINNAFNVLLDVAFEISQADIGSIMANNQAGEDLTIRAAKGIPEEVINTARVKIGEGISGIVAKEGKPFLINEKVGDNRIKPYLNRPYIGSSMVLPIKTENRVVGVMNLGILKNSVLKFSEETIQTMTKLMDLVNVTIPNA
jgi:ligand-binding sensor protein